MNSFRADDTKGKTLNHNPNDATQDIANSLKETLCRTGTIASIRAQLRAEVYRCMSESLATLDAPSNPSMSNKAISDQPINQSFASIDIDLKPPAPPIENVIINEIIADYLAFNGYHNTLSVFSAETRTPSLQSSGLTTRPCYGNVHDQNSLGCEDGSGESVLGMEFIREELGLNDYRAAGSQNNHNSSMAMMYDVVDAMKASRRLRGQRHLKEIS